MKEWKIGGIISFSIITIVYGIIIYILSTKPGATSGSIFEVLKTYPVIVLIFVPIGIVLGLIIGAIKFFIKPQKTRKKRGQIWVSTVLYIALGIVAMTVILSAGLPMINRMKERNTVIESKQMMHTIGDAISTVVTEGPGSKRVLDPVIIKGGKLIFDVGNNQVKWEMKTSTLLMEPCPIEKISNNECTEKDLIQREGSLELYLLETIVVDEYIINVLLDYSLKDINIEYSDKNKITGPLMGNYLIGISNDGSRKVGDNIITDVGIYIS